MTLVLPGCQPIQRCHWNYLSHFRLWLLYDSSLLALSSESMMHKVSSRASAILKYHSVSIFLPPYSWALMLISIMRLQCFSCYIWLILSQWTIPTSQDKWCSLCPSHSVRVTVSLSLLTSLCYNCSFSLCGHISLVTFGHKPVKRCRTRSASPQLMLSMS